MLVNVRQESDGSPLVIGVPPVLQSDTTAADSDKTFTVPAGKMWRILHILANLVTTVTVGNRQVEVWVTNAADNVLAKYKAGAVQAASLTYDYIFAPNLPRETAVVANSLLTPISNELILPAGYKLRIFDSGAIAATADNLTLRVLVEEVLTSI